MTPQQFAKKWKASTLKERSAAQEHFIDLCRMLGEQTPAEADPAGEWYSFERGAKITGGGEGWADVWRRGCFAWEYKGKHKDLTAAFAQLQRYAIALENPPLLVVSDMDAILIHTNFTNTVEEVHVIKLAEIGAPDNLRKLKWLFTDPERFRPGKTTAAITEEAASKFASLAQVLRQRGGEPQRVAHFLTKVLFCLFAEDAGVLPAKLVIRLLEAGLKHPDKANAMLRSLFGAMTTGGLFGADLIEWFNGGLFDSDDTLPLEPDDIRELLSVARLDWSSIEPSVFGTLFERGLDPSKRSQLGAHYTDPQSIMRIVQPVVVEPLAAEWEAAKAGIESALAKITRAVPLAKSKKKTAASVITGPRKQAEEIYSRFLHRLAEFRVLDPACGSGNFLYLALQALKDVEHRVMLEAEQLGLHLGFPGMHVGVQCVRGIELNSYAAELARVTVWIGEIQWMLRHGVPPSKNPILKPLETIECRDAVMNDDGSEPEWPQADVIIGNPPFLGTKKQYEGLGRRYTEAIRSLYKGRVPGFADLVCYWFEKARAQIHGGKARYAGLVATNSIRGGANRVVLDRIANSGAIFHAWSDEEWVNEGAQVRVSLVGFSGKDHGRPLVLDGQSVTSINPDLTSGIDATVAIKLSENRNVAFVATVKSGAFDIDGKLARQWLLEPNPNGAPNSDVVRPWANGLDVLRRPADKWIVDFGVDTPRETAALYDAPYRHVLKNVKPKRDKNNRKGYKDNWWRLAEPIPNMRQALRHLARYIATPVNGKHRIFTWMDARVLADHQLVVIARDDDPMFGILHSRFHEVWSLRRGTWLGVGNDPRYTPTTTFESFPFPDGMSPRTGPQAYSNPHAGAIGEAARRLVELRERWLNPPEWTERVVEVVADLPTRVVPRSGYESRVRSRTLTKLYNERPGWLEDAHRDLDAAVARAYGWSDYTPAMSDDELLGRLLRMNLEPADERAMVNGR
jgi:type II restriction/modification system DNA methylase subunit YeeA